MITLSVSKVRCAFARPITPFKKLIPPGGGAFLPEWLNLCGPGGEMVSWKFDNKEDEDENENNQNRAKMSRPRTRFENQVQYADRG